MEYVLAPPPSNTSNPQEVPCAITIKGFLIMLHQLKLPLSRGLLSPCCLELSVLSTPSHPALTPSRVPDGGKVYKELDFFLKKSVVIKDHKIAKIPTVKRKERPCYTRSQYNNQMYWYQLVLQLVLIVGNNGLCA